MNLTPRAPIKNDARLLRVLHVVPIVSQSGLWRHLEAADQLEGIASACIEVFDLGGKHNSGPLHMPLARLGARVSSYKRIARLTDRLLGVAEQFRPDVIHSYHVLSDAYAGRTARRLGVPLIRTVAGVAQTNWSGASTGSSVCLQWTTADVKQELAIEDVVHISLAVSDHVGRMICNAGIPAEKVRTSYLGTAWPVDPKPRVGIAGELTIGFPHRLEPVKLGPTLLPALRRIAEAGVRAKVVLVESGNRFGEFVHELEHVGADVQAVPPSSGLWESLPSIDCVVLDSLSEGLPLIPLEAMARGIPVALADVGGSSEALTNGIDGLLFRSGDVEMLTDHLLKLARQPNWAEAIGQAARRTVAARFSRDKHRADLKSTYREAAGIPIHG